MGFFGSYFGHYLLHLLLMHFFDFWIIHELIFLGEVSPITHNFILRDVALWFFFVSVIILLSMVNFLTLLLCMSIKHRVF